MTNMEDIERAYELGRAAERQKMADLASIASNETLTKLTTLIAASPTHVVKVPSATVSRAPRAEKAPAIARGVKKAGAPRTKGVKERIMSLLASHDGLLTIAEIVAQTGDKETSVAGTMQGLRKKGFAAQDENKRWHLIPPGLASGNSESATHADA